MLLKLLQKKKYSRQYFINLLHNDLQILEIGPFYSPVYKGTNVKYFDILNQEELIKRALQINPDVNANDIPFIDYASPTGDLSVVTETFDAVFSSHAVEHQWDLIDHFQKVSNLLRKGGKYHLMIPDKRFCFDYYNSITTVADVINANFEKRKRHSLKSVIEHRAFLTHNNPVEHWKGNHGFIYSPELNWDVAAKIKNALDEYSEHSFIDVHAWYFTPDSFAEIINILYKLKYINFKVNTLYPTLKNSLEFFVILEKNDSE